MVIIFLVFKYEKDPALKLAILLFPLAILLAGTVWEFNSYTDYVNLPEEIIGAQEKQKNVLSKKEMLYKKLEAYLGNNYPNHEKEIMISATKANTGNLLSSYPKLQFDQVILKLSEEISLTENEIQAANNNVTNLKTKLRTLTRNPFLISRFFMQTYNGR